MSISEEVGEDGSVGGVGGSVTDFSNVLSSASTSVGFVDMPSVAMDPIIPDERLVVLSAIKPIRRKIRQSNFFGQMSEMMSE